MCGIIAYIGHKKASEVLLKGIKALEYMGYDSVGIATIEGNAISVKKDVGKVDAANAKLDFLTLEGNMGIAHTRWSTHGGVTKENAHPHLDCSGTIAVVHNGIVENYDQIKKELIKKGHRFISQTDPEVGAHLIEEENQKYPFSEAVRCAFLKFSGLNAIVALDA